MQRCQRRRRRRQLIGAAESTFAASFLLSTTCIMSNSCWTGNISRDGRRRRNPFRLDPNLLPKALSQSATRRRRRQINPLRPLNVIDIYLTWIERWTRADSEQEKDKIRRDYIMGFITSARCRGHKERSGRGKVYEYKWAPYAPAAAASACHCNSPRPLSTDWRHCTILYDDKDRALIGLHNSSPAPLVSCWIIYIHLMA